MSKLTRELGNLGEVKTHVTDIKTEMANMARDIRDKPSNNVIETLFDKLANFATVVKFNALKKEVETKVDIHSFEGLTQTVKNTQGKL
jgi:hypothetical protein